MSNYSSGQVEKIVDLPYTTLRHWESVVSLIQPKKNKYGKRLYSKNDLKIIFRVKHLALEKNLGLAAAQKIIIKELTQSDEEILASLDELRSILIDVIDIVKKHKSYK